MEPSSKSRPQVGTLLSDVQPEEVRWLWRGRIPLGKVTVLDGDPGVGKSVITLDVAARVTTCREMPDGTPGVSGGVVLVTLEDDLADTVRPRLDAAQADSSQILGVSTVTDGRGDRLISIPGDLAVLKQAIERVRATLLIIDPLNAVLDAGLDANKDQDVRRALCPLAKLAEETGAASVVVRHLNKQLGGKAVYRGGGSIGIIAAARSGLLAATIPNSGEFALATVKCNLAPKAPSLRYRLETTDSGILRVQWQGKTPESADDLLAEPAPHPSKRQEARVFLQEKLAGGPLPSKELERLAREAGIADKTERRAREELGVESWQTRNGWVSGLPGARRSEGQMAIGSDTGDGRGATGSPEPATS